MDKIFAKTLFLGKKVYYLTQCHSTNDIMLEKISQETAREGDVVLTAHQMAGRGQRSQKFCCKCRRFRIDYKFGTREHYGKVLFGYVLHGAGNI